MDNALIAHIKKFAAITQEDENVILDYIQCKTLRKKEHLLKEGQVCTANYFVAKGCLRMYTMAENSTEQIIQFGLDNWWLADYMSMSTHKPSQFYIQAIENCDLIVLPAHIQEELFAKVPALERYFRLMFQKTTAAAQMRVHYIYNLSGKQRYELFSRLNPAFVQRVPQYMLASYLGFTPEFLSKIRAGKV